MTTTARLPGGTDDIVTEPPPQPPRVQRSWARYAPWVVVALTVLWGLFELRPVLRAVPYLDDSSIHEQMVRFAAARIRSGHLPQTSWFPYLGLGSPQFLHYQSLPAILSGLAGTVVDPDTAFRWSLYLLLALWPVTIYWCGRLFGLSRWTAASAAAVSPFLVSVPGIGYETKAYVWVGYGVWTQLWASWTLPLAWGFTYRAVRSLRSAVWAVLFVALTAALHFETGYLAFAAVVVFPFLVPSDLWRRLGRAVLMGAAALLASAWVVVPLLDQSHWAARNQILGGTPLENGYGARQILDWLFTGHLYDDGRFPIVTIFVFVGIAVCVARWRTFVAGRALVSIWAVTLLMTFGRTTFGALYRLLPGSSDIFIRRFEMGVHLSGILLAGVGLVFVAQAALDIARRLFWGESPDGQPAPTVSPSSRAAIAALCIVGLVVVLAPAWTNLDAYDTHNSVNVGLQAADDTQQATQLDQLLAYVRAHPRGRVYAGLPTNWGQDFVVGAVPVFKYLESKDIDEVGYTLRTASLMTDPEYYFDESNPGDYPLFGVGYLIAPEGLPSPVPAQRVACRSDYCLWKLPDPGYVHVYDTTGVLTATRADVGTRSLTLLGSPLLTRQRDLTVAFNGSAASAPTARSAAALHGTPGRVVAEHAQLEQGRVRAVVTAHRRATVVLSASYDPGWRATVDGHPAPTVMVAPALVGVDVGPGVHTVTFRYGGYGSYVPFFVLALVVLAGLAIATVLGWRRRVTAGISRPSRPS